MRTLDPITFPLLRLALLVSVKGTAHSRHLCRTDRQGEPVYVGSKHFLKWPGRIIRWKIRTAS